MKLCHIMPSKHEQRPNCGIYHVYMIFAVTMGTDGKFHCTLEFVRMTTKSVWSSKWTQLLNSPWKLFYSTDVDEIKFSWKLISYSLKYNKSIFCLMYSFPKINIQSWVKNFLNHTVWYISAIHMMNALHIKL